ncbi:tetratricopeptide repeat protein [Meiothermus rufus]|uniref:tetratricopeptide repeat protein n=1 Tax=Meiothermus rufus TaxID=604332 RepID=UPI0004266975|nr:tetratricopeptide repeat protein [Meiothermus rufus]
MTQLDAATGIERALQHLANGEPVLALRVLDRVSWMDLGWPEYWQVRAEAYLRLGAYRQAASSAKEGLAENPSHLPLWVVRIRALLELGELDKAQHALIHATSLFPGDLELERLARALEERMGQPAKVPVASTSNKPFSESAWPSSHPLLAKTEFSRIERIKPRNPVCSNEPRSAPSTTAFLWPLFFLLWAGGSVAFWLWRHVAR